MSDAILRYGMLVPDWRDGVPYTNTYGTLGMLPNLVSKQHAVKKHERFDNINSQRFGWWGHLCKSPDVDLWGSQGSVDRRCACEVHLPAR